MTKPIPKIRLKEAILTAGLPEDSKFLGYAIHIESSDEFLSDAVVNQNGSLLTFCLTPELAKTYRSYKRALKIAALSKHPAIVVELFDSGEHLLVSQPHTPSQIVP